MIAVTEQGKIKGGQLILGQGKKYEVAPAKATKRKKGEHAVAEESWRR